MARGIEGNEVATPRPSLKKATSSQSSKPGTKQLGINAFFQKRTAPATPAMTPAKRGSEGIIKADAAKVTENAARDSSPPTSSSPPPVPGASQASSLLDGRNKENGMLNLAVGLGRAHKLTADRNARHQLLEPITQSQETDQLCRVRRGGRRGLQAAVGQSSCGEASARQRQG